MNFDKINNRKGTYCTQWDYIKDRFGEEDLLPFTISDMDFESPEEIINAISKRVSHKIFGYSRWNHDDFKNSIFNWFFKRFNFKINKEWISYSPSVIYTVSKFIEIKSKKGDCILMNTPNYDGFFNTILSNNRKLITSPLKEVNKKYEIDFDDFEKKCKYSKIFILCSPHNPIGRVWTNDELAKIVEICKKYNVFIISDEIHMDIIYCGNHHPILSIAEDYLDNIVLCTSSSKTFNTAALGGSYALIPNKNDKDLFLKILKNRDALSSPTIFSIISNMAAYNHCEYWLEELLLYTNNNLKYTKKYIDDNIPELDCILPDALYFMWIDFSKLNISSEKFQEYLIKIAIMPGITYGKEGESFLRLNIGCSRNKLEDGLKRIEKTVKYLRIF